MSNGAGSKLAIGAMVAALLAVSCSSRHVSAPTPAQSAPTSGTTSSPSPTSGSSFPGNQAVLGSPGNRPAWMLEQFSVQALLGAGLPQQTLQALFDDPQSIIITKLGDQIPDPLLPHATYAMTFANFTALQAAVDAGQIPGSVRYLLFDDEKWPATPSEEQQNPFSYARQAEAVAHSRGLGLIFTPAANLSEVLSSSYSEASKYDGYLALGIPRSGAAVCDIYEIQGQQDEGRPGFLSFAQQAVDQARAANPSGEVFLGLTTKAPGQTVTPALLEADFNATRNEVTGYWLNIPSPHGPENPGVAVAFLQAIAGQTGG